MDSQQLYLFLSVAGVALAIPMYNFCLRPLMKKIDASEIVRELGGKKKTMYDKNKKLTIVYWTLSGLMFAWVMFFIWLFTWAVSMA